MYGTQANNAQLNEINKTHAGPQFEEVDIPLGNPVQWEVSFTSAVTNGTLMFFRTSTNGAG